MKFKALSFTQPWATLVAIGAKNYETRSWRTSYTGPLAIHASKGWTRDDIECCFELEFRKVLKHVIKTPADLPRGSVIAVCNLVGCWRSWELRQREIAGLSPEVTEQERAFGDFRDGRHFWEFADVKILPEPIPAKGNRLLWEVELPDSVFELLKRGTDGT